MRKTHRRIFVFDEKTKVDKYWYLHRFKWFRRFCGGYWENWYVEICHGRCWYYYPHGKPSEYLSVARDRPACTSGTPITEDYRESKLPKATLKR